ncbi:hypothetical protein RM697_03820 [Ichthyenterobacterium sp. W332]|uniref:Uncharacterized protein n=1 Tax=Microcosmobacter mediterraneus TaxID=3075607 RepID=A0ABU2YL46_9FLAO|nr:hypothetical protein [Ichthyenterobacterium sp. W332]MDT0557758.1 hypothetical protein [Ichthyenterobacterium sp. W332]
MLKKLCLALFLLSTLNVTSQNTESSGGIPVSGKWYGWSNMMLMNNDGVINATYSDTWARDLGYVQLYFTNGEWRGQWGERSIGRRGIFYNVVVSEDGKNISGKYSVVEVGSMGGPKEDIDFNWYFVESDDEATEEEEEEDESEENPCEFTDLSGVWKCEGRGHFELRQTNMEVDGDCVSYIEGRFIRGNCTGDLWAMSHKTINYVRGKIVNGKYKLEIFPHENKENIYGSRQRSLLSGTIEVGAESFNPSIKFGLNHVEKEKTVITDPHNGEEVVVMQWEYPPINITKNKCEFKKSSKKLAQNPNVLKCNQCEKQNLEKGLTFDNGRFTNTDERLMVEDKDAQNPRYAVGSGTAEAAGRDLWYTSDLMNGKVNTVPRYNLKITKVERDGRYIDVFYEICDWKTGKITKKSKSHIIKELTESQLNNLPDDDLIMQGEYRKAGFLVYEGLSIFVERNNYKNP